MFLRTHRSLRALLLFFVSTVSISLLHAAPTKAEETEAQQLYSRANDYVSNISESGFSYSYIQFYWKRAQSNLDRIARVYPETLAGRQLRSNEVKVGPFDLAYFKDRVLPRLEEKKLGAFDAVNCAIFLYNLDENRLDAERMAALESIIEVLCRQQRWNEALAFPVLDPQRALLNNTVFRVAARYSEQKVLKERLARATPEEKTAYWPILGEAMALIGTSRTEIARFVEEHPEASVRAAILSGMITREIDLQRAKALRMLLKTSFPKTHYSLSKLDVRDDIEAAAKTLFPQPTAESMGLVSYYKASTGEKPDADAAINLHLGYLEYLATVEKWSDLASHIKSVRLTPADRRTCELKGIELWAGRPQNSDDNAAGAFALPEGSDRSDAAILAEFRGKMNARDRGLAVRNHTFSNLKLKDPCVLAQLVMEWALVPNQSIRGAAPWDSVVQRFLPGFDDLPLPKSKAVQDASSASKPY